MIYHLYIPIIVGNIIFPVLQVAKCNGPQWEYPYMNI